VVFDAVGTLIDSRPDVVDVYLEAGRRFGSYLSRQQVAARFRDAFRSCTANGQTSEASERRRWKRIVELVFDDVDQAGGELFEGLWEHFAEPSHWVVFEDVPPTWLALKRIGMVLAIGSNFDSRLIDVCQGLDPLRNTPHVFCSSRIGYAKPHAEFFQHVARALNLAPGEILLIGDDRQADIDGARRCGWQALWLDRSANGPSDGAISGLDVLGGLFTG
jgi:putative hydrolase of the HAD superfamily